MSAELSEFDRYVLRLFDRAGSLERAKRKFGRAIVRAAITECAGNWDLAAERLGIHRNTIYRYLGSATKRSELK